MRITKLLQFISTWIAVGTQECFEQQYANHLADLRTPHIVQRIAVIAPLSAFHIQSQITSDEEGTDPSIYDKDENWRNLIKTENGEILAIYSSSSSANLEWYTLNLLASAIRIMDVFGGDERDQQSISPVVIITACPYKSRPVYLDSEPFTVDTHQAGLIAMYENELVINFRTFENGIFFFSMADQGDLLIAQVSRGQVEIFFDFGSTIRSSLSGGRALNDGQWHELRWIHKFDSVQLFVDRVLLNSTTPAGLYRKLDFNHQIEIGGRPDDQYSGEIHTSFHGCLVRVQLNNVDLLSFAPGSTRDCQMPRPQTISLRSGAALIPYSFLPFILEFRVLAKPASLLSILDSENSTLLELIIDDSQCLSLKAEQKQVKQNSVPAIRVIDGAWHSLSIKLRGGRLDVDVDETTVLWLEGQLVRRIGLKMTYFRLGSIGCYRSTTVDLKSAETEGGEDALSKDKCAFQDRCLPNPCENNGLCLQTTLDSFRCDCTKDYSGTFCHTSLLPRSCEDHRLSKRPKRGKGHSHQGAAENITIDLDGGGSLKPFKVSCLPSSPIKPHPAPTSPLFPQKKLNSFKPRKDDIENEMELEDEDDEELGAEVTLLNNDSNDGIYVSGMTEPGAVRRVLTYGSIQNSELDRFVDGFEGCRQFMRFECKGGTKLMTYGTERRPSTWYATRNGQHGLQWADAPPYSRMCSCALNASCDHNRMCNCDSGRDGVDEGYNTHLQLLPVMQLWVGGTEHKSSANITIGPLRCTKRYVFETVTFMDKNQQMVGSQNFDGPIFDLYIQLKFTHPQMTIFTWESPNAERWFQLFVREGRIVGQLVNSGRNHEIVSSLQVNNNRWHTVYWEIDRHSMKLAVDRQEKMISSFYLLPSTFTFIVGSRTGRGSSGFAGQIRNFYLCGEEIQLGQMARKLNPTGIQSGDTGYCSIGMRCLNGGECIELYDSFKCNCTETPFRGDKCDQEVGMFVPLGSQLSIPWQHPAQTSTCYRINVHTESSNVSLIRAKALFAESSYNMSIDSKGHLSVQMYDGFFHQHNKTYDKLALNDNRMKDIQFCASKTDFKLTVNEETAVYLEGNFTFFVCLNVWNFIDSNFTGCVSRLKIGNGYPLKNPKSSRLSYTGRIKFGTCPYNPLEYHPISDEREEADAVTVSDIHISAIVRNQQQLLLITPAIGILTALILVLALCIFVFYVRSRPDGVYKTNENLIAYCSPSKSVEPLVTRTNVTDTTSMFTKEYFC